MSIENLAEDMLNESEGGKKPKVSGRIEDDIIEGSKVIADEIHELQLRAEESKEAKLPDAAEFQKELDSAKQELKEWEKLMKLAEKKRKPTLAEAAVLKEARLEALQKAAAAAKGAGVENLERVPTALNETETELRETEPAFETRVGLRERGDLREKERLLREARLWLKKATIIQALMEQR